MFVEIGHNEFKGIENFFNENKYQIPALAVLNRNFPGKVFVDNNDKPEIVLVWAISRWSYISCKEQSLKHKDFIKDVFNNRILPLMKTIGEKRFEVYADNNTEWDSMLNEALNDYQLGKYYENTFVLNKEKFIAFTSHLKVPKDIEICENTFPIIPEKYESYVEYDKTKMKVCGMTLKKKGNIISQCLNNGFIYNNYYFIDLDTFDKGERNNGYGTFVSYKLICSELKKGLLPLWETTTDNLPSQRVAHKLGFEKIDEYPVYTITGY